MDILFTLLFYLMNKMKHALDELEFRVGEKDAKADRTTRNGLYAIPKNLKLICFLLL